MPQVQDSTRVDLQQLKARLEKLGVHIEEPDAQEEPGWEPLVENNVERHNKTLATLLGRCARVQHALHTTGDSEASCTSSEGAQAAEQQAATAADTVHARNQSHSRCEAAGRLKSSDRQSSAAAGAHGSKPAVAAAAAAAAAARGSAAAAQADSKLLVRAAQRLLEDAQEDAQQVSRGLRAAAAAAAAAGAAPGKRAAGRAAAGAAGGGVPGVRRPAGASAAAAASVDDLRNSPLGTVLAQYKEAQAAWAQEKAKLRREAVAARKEASQARLELSRVCRSSEHRAQEASCLKAALKGRDVLLEELQGRTRQLEDELASCQEVAAERLVSVSRERDDLQALLLATLERLEGVEAVVAAADATSAAMEDKVRVLESERLAALQTAATARQEVAELQEARRRLQWQSQLLEKMSKVQLQHTKRKSEALRELLASAEQAAAVEPAGATAERKSSTAAAHESCGRASAALQDLLDELLAGREACGEQ